MCGERELFNELPSDESPTPYLRFYSVLFKPMVSVTRHGLGLDIYNLGPFNIWVGLGRSDRIIESQAWPGQNKECL